MSLSFVLLIVTCIVILIAFVRHYQIRRQHPPGPLGLPFVGQIPYLILRKVFSKYLPKISQGQYFSQMKKKYGDIWSIGMGDHRLVVIASFDIFTEAFIENGKLFSGRSPHESIKMIGKGRGILFSDGELWHNNRQLAIKALRDLGMGKQVVEGKICNEADELIKYIEHNLSTPIASPAIFAKAVSNVICQLSFDERNKYNDPNFEFFNRNVKRFGHSNGAHDIMVLFSKVLPTKYAKKLFPRVEKLIEIIDECMQFIEKKCRSRIKSEAEYFRPPCIFDYFWRYLYQDDPEIDPQEKFLNISHSMFDLFIAGTDTTTNVLGFSCLLLGQYTDVQEDLRNEIQSFTDDYKLINIDMRKDCPKLLSFIDEVQRYVHLIPILQRRAMETCTFRGYKIQSNDIFYGDLAGVLKDPIIFDCPDDFHPYRFMDESRTKYIPNKYLIPFGMGKRVCLGEGIAVMELFVFLSKIIQRFKISLPEMNLSKILKGTTGIVHAPLDHEIIFQALY